MVTDDKEQPVESHRLFELGEYGRMKTNDLTQGSIGKGYILFAIPLFLGSLFQQLYNTVDMLFVGNVLGKNAAAAVGASSILVTCLINLFTGVAVGAGIVISQLFGAKKEKDMKEAVWIAVLAGAVGGLILTVIGVTCSQAVLVRLHTPANIIPDAVLYVRIYFLSAIPMVLYNMCSGILRAQGDSRTPFHALAAGGVLNVITDAVFLILLDWGVAGVAVATLFSQSMTTVFLLIHNASSSHIDSSASAVGSAGQNYLCGSSGRNSVDDPYAFQCSGTISYQRIWGKCDRCICSIFQGRESAVPADHCIRSGDGHIYRTELWCR